jgi:hypothetical protein
MGYPLRLTDGTVALLELRSGARLNAEEAAALVEYVEFLRDKSDAIKLARQKLASPPLLPVGADYMRGSHRRIVEREPDPMPVTRLDED